MVDREAEAEGGELLHVGAHHGGAGLELVGAQFEDHGAREVAVLGHEFEEEREQGRVFEGGRGNVAEDADAAVALGEAADDLHAAEYQEVVHRAHQVGAAGGVQEIGWQDQRAIGAAQAREALIEGDAALRQRHDRLQVQVDTAGLQRFAYVAQQGVFEDRIVTRNGDIRLALFHAESEALDHFLEMFHLLDEPVTLFAEFVLDRLLERIGARFDDLVGAGNLRDDLLDRIEPGLRLFRGRAGARQDVDLTEHGGRDCPARNRQGQSHSGEREDAIAHACASREV